jgi:hypothetical protein
MVAMKRASQALAITQRPVAPVATAAPYRLLALEQSNVIFSTYDCFWSAQLASHRRLRGFRVGKENRACHHARNDWYRPFSPRNHTPQPDADLSGLVWTPLITGDWSLPAGEEDPSDDHSITLDRDIYVGAIRPIDPVGTHHTLLDNGGAGVIYASGVGTNEVIFPPGVGLKLTAGTTLNLQLHIFNPGGSAISGTSGVEIVEVAEADITDIADIFLPGPFDFVLAPMQQTVHSGSCTVTQAQTLFALFPHMHQLGTHFKMSVTKGGTEQMVHDKPYDFNEQTFTKFDPISLSPGDSVNTECTWLNTTAQGVFWGDGSNQEMCFSILYRYPALSDGEFCDDSFTP